jgi:hypothetical protein
MKVHESKFLTIFHEKEFSCLDLHWTQATADMEEDEYKKEVETLLTLSRRYKISSILSNAAQFDFIIDPNLQTWHQEYVFPEYQKLGVRKRALIKSRDFTSQISLQQMIDVEDFGFETRFFDQVGTAKVWLVE